MHNWKSSEAPGEVVYQEGEELKKLNISDDAWNKTKEVLGDNCEASDIINFLKLDTETEEIEVQ